MVASPLNSVALGLHNHAHHRTFWTGPLGGVFKTRNGKMAKKVRTKVIKDFIAPPKSVSVDYRILLEY